MSHAANSTGSRSSRRTADTARGWHRHPLVSGVIMLLAVALVVAVVLRHGAGDDGWPPTASVGPGAGLSDGEVVRRAGTNLRIRCHDRTADLDALQWRILGLLPLYTAGASPDQATMIARNDPATGRSPVLERLEQALAGFTAPTCLALLRTRLMPLARQVGMGPMPAAAAGIDREFAAAWAAERVEAQAVELIRAHQGSFQ